MKKLFALALVLCMMLVLCACGAKAAPAAETEAQDDGIPTFDEINAANTYENYISIFGSYMVTLAFNGEEPESETYYDGTGRCTLYKWDGCADYCSSESFYHYSDGEVFPFIDPVGVSVPEDPSWDCGPFRSVEASEVQSVEKTETGYLVTFEPNAEKAQFFCEDYHEGDVFVIYETLREDLTVECVRQVIIYADGTENELNRSLLTPIELPDFVCMLRDHASPDEANKATATVVTGPGTDEECVYSIVFTKGDRLQIEPYDYNIYDDEACTVPHELGTEDTTKDVLVYAANKVTGISRTECYYYDENGNELGHEIYWFDESFEQTASDIAECPEGVTPATFIYVEYDQDGNEYMSQSGEWYEDYIPGII